ncbi:MAG TPA: glycosyltransferase family 1 protein [Anaerolineae bacterium]|nr:glycosyltransferase family 1 protein [Anaerolineae bacterium]HID84144.1 alpha-glucan family phosphorylase [Anaerolineales bacterium]HIQ08911.1 alpha-glucan family phosphorylase [Anaerolineaceae bacterium]
MAFREIPPNHFSLPKRIERLGELAYNLWWTWKPNAQRLFTHIDKALWEETGHNPIRFLRQVARAQLNAVAADRYYLALYDRILRQFDAYLQARDTWFRRQYPDVQGTIAYFSTEFGLHETLPIYAGGLGVLSGDHLKEASDLGLPLVAVGFFYTHGYFTQRISDDGWQEALGVDLAYEELPIVPLYEEDGVSPLTVSVTLPGRELRLRLWKIQVGRIPLYLLDADVEDNAPEDRALTSRLYLSDLELRIAQELVLGIGGVRALRRLGYNPTVWHMNEGHSAFMTLERIREYVAQGLSFAEAKQQVSAQNVFTTHTPVPAGNDEFPVWLVEKYFAYLWPELGLTREQFLDLARQQHTWGETFSMPILAFCLSRFRNGVSELHGQVARRMWHFLWPDRREDEVPISHVTNGVHLESWLARRLTILFDRYLGPDWREHMDDPAVWEQVERIPDAELWAVHRHLKRKLVAFMRERARKMWLELRVHPVQVVAAGALLDPYALTIGFARRFATYKRASLVLRNFERLLELLNRPNMPVQIIFAGKAHPADEPGKRLIQEVYRKVKLAENGGRLVFIEDYDMNVARHLVQGVDVWLNTPRRPNEASGTSGMKAAINGVLNFSVLDGWWREGYNGHNGWAIGEDCDYEDPDLQDEADAESLYETLENEIIPMYYRKRSSDGLPGEWIARMKESIRTVAPQFSTRRMLKEYLEQLYLPIIQGQLEKVSEDL